MFYIKYLKKSTLIFQNLLGCQKIQVENRSEISTGVSHIGTEIRANWEFSVFRDCVNST